MTRYPLPPQMTRDRFHGLITDLNDQLTRNGIDPVSNMIVSARDEVLDDGTTLTHFSIIVSDAAAEILKSPRQEARRLDPVRSSLSLSRTASLVPVVAPHPLDLDREKNRVR